MSNILTRLASGNRAIPKTGLGMSIQNPTAGGSVKAATTSSTYMAPNMPMTLEWDAANAVEQYLGHTWVMRCLRTKADTIAGLPFRAGPDPDDPSTVTLGAPLSRLLGPASPQQPGGPNARTSARALWAWSIIQYNVTGRMAWEQQLDPKTKEIIGLWPLVSAALLPIPSAPGKPYWFESYEYQTPIGTIPLSSDRVFYGWKMSAKDPRQAESILQAAKLPISIAMACDKYMWGLLRNGMVASKIVITPPFEDDGDRRAWEEQFFSEFSGFDNAGKTVFAEAENAYDQSGKVIDQANVQVVDLSMSSVDAQLLQMVAQAKIDITIATGVPESLVGNASQRTYANADSEYRNFWTITVVPDISDLQDLVNINLAPLLGDEVGWFDLSRVVALQPPTIFQPPAITDAINAGIITAEQASNLLNIPSSSATGENIDTSPIGEESSQTGAGGQRSGGSGYRSIRIHGQGSQRQDAPDGWKFRYRPLTTHTLQAGNAGWGLVQDTRARLIVSRIRSAGVRAETPELANEITAAVAAMRRKRLGDFRQERIAELEELAALSSGLRVGPAGYIHGWIKVGADGATSKVDAENASDAAIAAGAHANALSRKGSGATRDTRIAAHHAAVTANTAAAQEAIDRKDVVGAQAHMKMAEGHYDKMAKLQDAARTVGKRSLELANDDRFGDLANALAEVD